ncbi:MAG: hypothetical protein ACOYB3_09465 [Azonexus sp.]
MIKESKNAKKELVASTVRMPKELHSFVDELAEHLSLSKQEVLLKLIEEGASVAQDELRLDSADQEQERCVFHILNTNKRHSIADHDRMITDGIAAAFYGPWKFNIDRIEKDDVVFLYENGVGIVAYGMGTGETLTADHNGNIGECHYQKLRGFRVLSKALAAHEIKKILNRNVVFLKTMSGLPDGEKLLKNLQVDV